MSEATKKAAQETSKHLKSANEYLDAAQKSASQTGDSSLTKKVERLQQDTSQVRQDLEKRITEK